MGPGCLIFVVTGSLAKTEENHGMDDIWLMHAGDCREKALAISDGSSGCAGQGMHRYMSLVAVGAQT